MLHWASEYVQCRRAASYVCALLLLHQTIMHLWRELFYFKWFTFIFTNGTMVMWGGNTCMDDSKCLAYAEHCRDVLAVINALYKDQLPPLVLMGHR